MTKRRPQQYSFAAAIARIATERDMPVAEIGRRMGWPRTDVSPIVNGHKEPYLHTAERFAAALGVSMAELAAKAKLDDSALFHSELVREVAKKMPLTVRQHNIIVRFIKKWGTHELDGRKNA